MSHNWMPEIQRSAPDSCVCGWEEECVCCNMEKSIRCFAYKKNNQPMTPAQREECLGEIASVEGYTRAEYENVDDAILAHGVLCAWTDYCRDKGLL